METYQSTKLLQLTGRWQYVGTMGLALRSVKPNKVDFINQIPYFSAIQLSSRGWVDTVPGLIHI